MTGQQRQSHSKRNRRESLSPRPRLSRTLSSNIRHYRLHAPGHDPRTWPSGSYGTTQQTRKVRSPVLEETASLLEVDHLHHEPSRLNEHNIVDGDESSEHADSDGLYPPRCTWTSNVTRPERADPFGNSDCRVWNRIHEVRTSIIESIDDPYSLDQLKSPRMNISIVRPLVDKFYEFQDLSIVYCLLVNRMQFIREQSYATHHQTTNLTRALLCELVADKVLRRFNENNPGPLGLLKLANILVAGFEPFQGAPEEAIRNSSHAMHWAHQRKGDKYERKMTALEIAIVSESKSFLASSACQKVVDAIYRGKIVYSPSSFIDIIPDHWKRRPISLYDPRRAPLLNQYRLIVPRTRNLIEIVQFITLIVLYILVMSGRETRKSTKYTPLEAVFDVYAGGWVLDQLASILEHGWQVYTQNMWSFLDVVFSLQYLSYFICRMHALRMSDEAESIKWATTALDILSCAAPVLIPRLAFNVMSENMLFLSLRSMMGDFLTLTGLALWSFGGFLLSLKWLHNGLHNSLTIGKWMIWIWFGLDGTGIDRAHEFHNVLGPILMIAFAFLGNTLFLTILVSMLSNTFSMITENAVQEIQYRRSVLTFMGVKSDAIFAYMPPFNLTAMALLLPAKWILSPHLFHTINVAAVKILNMPILLLISAYERRTLWVPDRFCHTRPRTLHIDWKHKNGPRGLNNVWWSRTFQFWDLSRFSVHGDIQAVFDEMPANYNANANANANANNNNNNLQSEDEPPVALARNLKHSKRPASNKSTLTHSTDEDRQQPRIRRQRQRSVRLSSNAALRRDFFDSFSDDADSGNPTTPEASRKPTRKDSLIDYSAEHLGTVEGNARLHRLEQSIEKIEKLLSEFIGEGIAEEDESTMQNKLRHELEAETTWPI